MKGEIKWKSFHGSNLRMNLGLNEGVCVSSQWKRI